MVKTVKWFSGYLGMLRKSFYFVLIKIKVFFFFSHVIGGFGIRVASEYHFLCWRRRTEITNCIWKKRGQSVAEVSGEVSPGTEKSMLRPRRNEVLRQWKSSAEIWGCHRKWELSYKLMGRKNLWQEAWVVYCERPNMKEKKKRANWLRY